MFLNLNNNRNNQLLSSGKYHYKQKQNYFQDDKKRKAYSSSTLKEQFKQFKNKSLSHSNLNLLNQSQCKKIIDSTFKRKDELKMDWKHQKRHFNEFKKNTLKLDTKLNNFKRIQNHRIYQNQNQQTENQQSYFKCRSPQKILALPISSNNQLINEIDLLRQEVKILTLQNDELKSQRKADLQLISQQTQNLKRQQKLIASNEEIIIINDLLKKQQTHQQQRAYQYSQVQKASFHRLVHYQCINCSSKQNQCILENQMMLRKISKLQEDKKIMKKQLHSLIFECQKLKQVLKKSQNKYQKQLKHNQKLIKIFYKQEQNKKQNTNIQKPSTSIIFNSNQYYPIKKSFTKQNKRDNIQNQKRLHLNIKVHDNNDIKNMDQLKVQNFHQYDRTQKSLIKDLFMQINKKKAQQIDLIQYLLE